MKRINETIANKRVTFILNSREDYKKLKMAARLFFRNRSVQGTDSLVFGLRTFDAMDLLKYDGKMGDTYVIIDAENGTIECLDKNTQVEPTHPVRLVSRDGGPIKNIKFSIGNTNYMVGGAPAMWNYLAKRDNGDEYLVKRLN